MADDNVLSIREKMEEIYEGSEPEATCDPKFAKAVGRKRLAILLLWK